MIYPDADRFESLFGRLFTSIAEDEPERLQALVDQQMVICFDVTDPDVTMWVDGRAAPVRTSFGPSEVTATLTARLSGDTLHALLLGTLPLGRALFRRKLKVGGSKRAAMKLEDLLHACQATYPALADELLGPH